MNIDSEAVIELAAPFASFDYLTEDQLKETYRNLNEDATAAADIIIDRCKSLDDAWRKLIPILDRMQSLLSQRGKARIAYRNAELPTWSGWYEGFCKRKEFGATLRTAQKRIRNFRGYAPKDKPSRSEPDPRLSLDNQRRLLEAALSTTDLIKAYEADRDIEELIHKIKKLIDPECLSRMIEATTSVAENSFPPSTESSNKVPARTVLPPAELAGCSPLPLPLTPEAGDWRHLVETVIARCGTDFEATFRGMNTEQATSVFGRIAQKLAKLYCPMEQDLFALRVSIELTERPSIELTQAA